MNTANIKPTHPWTWRDKLRTKLFPFTPCPPPAAPKGFKDCVVTRVRSDLRFSDRLRVLLTGKVEVEVRVVTQHAVGGTKTNSVLRAGRFF